MAVGFRMFKDFQRPEPELVEAFRGIPSSNIGDCVRKMTCMFGGIRPFNKHTLLGVAFTVKVPSGDNLAAQMALDYAKPGDIIVIDGAGYTDRALVGGMMLAYAGMLADKEVTWLPSYGPEMRGGTAIRASSLPVFAKAVTPLGPYREGPGEINVPVVCGGQVVMPGDILVGDADGVVVIPRKDACELLEAARKNLAGEQEEIHLMKEGLYTESKHRDNFTNMFLRHGGSISE